jgi:hypothetical protein
MHRFRVNILKKAFRKLKADYPESANYLERIVEYAGPKAIIYMDKVDGLPVNLTDLLWRLALRLDEKHFSSYYVQLREILGLPKSEVESILEIGPGQGILKSLLLNYPYRLTTLDISDNNAPDIVCDILHCPIKEKTFDLVMCFQVLEHIPYSHFSKIISLMASIARSYVFISIPYQRNTISFRMTLTLVNRYISRLSGSYNLTLPIHVPQRDISEKALAKREDKQNPHYWEAGRRSFPIKRIVGDIESDGLSIVSRFHNPDFPYHYFILSKVL